ncbi:phage late control D family protein [Helicobacter felis]|uniref:phage late control D family protein n=1 Tax=Helicobacter felis TaxID=214 RepID=UPI001315996A|nr:contractile injection system protein, VgrG/Pvc8 family [Helicobacter felis]
MSGVYLRPRFRVHHNKLNDLLVESVNYTDYEKDQVDTLNLKLAPNSKLPKFGDRLDFWLGWTNYYYMGGFYVSAIKETYRKGYSIDATAINFTKEMAVRKSRSFNNIRVADIVRVIAREHGLKNRINFKFADNVLDVMEQTDESDMSFCARLAKEYGCSFSVKNDTILFYDRDIKNYERRRYKMNADACISLEIEYLTTKHYRSVEVHYTDKAGKEQIVKVGNGIPVRTLTIEAKNDQQAYIAGTAKLKELNTQKTKGSLQALGQVLFAGGLLELHKGGKKETHIITQTEHSLDKSSWNMRVQFEHSDKKS